MHLLASLSQPEEHKYSSSCQNDSNLAKFDGISDLCYRFLMGFKSKPQTSTFSLI